jgi:hypothetical protein
LHQFAHKGRGFISGDAAGHADENFAAVHGSGG